MSDLSDLTFVVLTYNRPDHIIKQMRYWSGSSATMHVFDGSDKIISKDKLSGIKGNIRYHHMPCSSQIRVGKAADIVDTKYVIYACDDEYHIQSSLEHCIQKLEADKELVSCIGRCLGFYITPSGVKAKPMYTSMKGYHVDADTSRERMIMHMDPYVPSTIYAITRADVWKRSMKIISSGTHLFTPSYIGEFQFELATCYQGKSLVIEDLMWLRNMYNKPVNINNIERKILFDDWLHGSKYSPEVNCFYDTLSDGLAKIDGVNRSQVFHELKDSVDTYLCYYRRTGFKRRLAALKNNLMNFVPHVLRSRFESMHYGPILDEAEHLRMDGVVVDMEQLRKIIKQMEG